MNAMRVYYTKQLGRYNWAGTEKNWNVSLSTDFGTVSEMWDADDEPEIDDLLPSEVLDIIEARCRYWWISTERDEKLERIAAIRAHKNEIDMAWLEKQAQIMEKRGARYRSQINDILSEMEDEAA